MNRYRAALLAFMQNDLQMGTRKIKPDPHRRPDKKFLIARRFKALRKKAPIPLTQKTLGRIIGVCRQSICEIERGRVMLHQSTWERFLDLETKHRQARKVSQIVHWPKKFVFLR